MRIEDEHYQMRPTPCSRRDVDVLARLDTGSVDTNVAGVHRTDCDFPVAWIKRYGAGRVFYSGLGHTVATWDEPRIRSMYYEGILWALGATRGTVVPHPLPGRARPSGGMCDAIAGAARLVVPAGRR